MKVSFIGETTPCKKTRQSCCLAKITAMNSLVSLDRFVVLICFIWFNTFLINTFPIDAFSSAHRCQRAVTIGGIRNAVIRITPDRQPNVIETHGLFMRDRPTSASDERNEPNLYRSSQHQQASNDDGSKSTIAYLSKLAERWAKAEMEYYQDSTDYVPLKGTAPSLQHLEKAYGEFVKRFTYDNMQAQDEYEDTCYDSPCLLVARHVKDTWQVPEAFYKRHGNVKFMLVPGETKNTSTLFITYLAGNVHGTLDATISDEIGAWQYCSSQIGVLHCPLRTFSTKLQPPMSRLMKCHTYLITLMWKFPIATSTSKFMLGMPTKPWKIPVMLPSACKRILSFFWDAF
jgi:hypothetical protein